MFLKERLKGQANKGAGRMPWHWEPMKDVISCDKLGELQISIDPEISE